MWARSSDGVASAGLEAPPYSCQGGRASGTLARARPHRFEKRLGGVRQLAAATIDQPDLPRRSETRDVDGRKLAARDFRQRAPSRQHRDAEPGFHRALDAVQARQRYLDVDRRVPTLVEAQDPLPRRRRIVVRDDGLTADLFERYPPPLPRADAAGASAARARPSRARSTWRPLSGGWNVRTPQSRLRLSSSVAIWRDGTRRTSTSACG